MDARVYGGVGMDVHRMRGIKVVDMAWIVIFLVFAVAFGPLLYLLPTRKDRRLAAMRGEARRQGLTVELKPVRKLEATADERVSAGGRTRSPTHKSIAYGLPLHPALKHVGPWRLLRSVSDRWVFDDEFPVPGDAGLLPALLPYFSKLPPDTVAVECVRREISCYWLERFPADGEAVKSLKKTLAALGEYLLAKDAELAHQLMEGEGED